jgi:hypothetical protein
MRNAISADQFYTLKIFHFFVSFSFIWSVAPSHNIFGHWQTVVGSPYFGILTVSGIHLMNEPILGCDFSTHTFKYLLSLANCQATSLTVRWRVLPLSVLIKLFVTHTKLQPYFTHQGDINTTLGYCKWWSLSFGMNIGIITYIIPHSHIVQSKAYICTACVHNIF